MKVINFWGVTVSIEYFLSECQCYTFVAELSHHFWPTKNARLKDLKVKLFHNDRAFYILTSEQGLQFYNNSGF